MSRQTPTRGAPSSRLMIARQVLEPVSEIGPLTCRMLQEQLHPTSRAAPAGATPAVRDRAAVPAASVPVVCEPGCMIRPSRPRSSARSSSSPSAAIDRAAKHRVGCRDVDEIAVVRNDGMECGVSRPDPETRDLVGGSGRARHCPTDLVKICSASQRVATARSTARGSPPAIDRCAPSRGTQSPNTSASKR